MCKAFHPRPLFNLDRDWRQNPPFDELLALDRLEDQEVGQLENPIQKYVTGRLFPLLRVYHLPSRGSKTCSIVFTITSALYMEPCASIIPNTFGKNIVLVTDDQYFFFSRHLQPTAADLISAIEINHPNIVGLLASFVFDLVHSLMTSPKLDLLPILKQFSNEIKLGLPDSQPGTIVSPTSDQGDELHCDNQERDDLQTPNNWKKPMKNTWWFRIRTSENCSLWSTCPQQAWPFFVDFHHYPKGWVFPTYWLCREEKPIGQYLAFHENGQLSDEESSDEEIDDIESSDEESSDEEFRDEESSDEEEGRSGFNVDGAGEEELEQNPPDAFLSGKMDFYPSVTERMVPFWE
jgi:hypothetical protein